MINILINFVFYIINFIYKITVGPFLSVVFNLFPSLGTFFSSFVSLFDNYIIPYIFSFKAFFYIPNFVVVTFINYVIIKNLIFLSISAFKFSVNIYEKFKP